MRLVAGALILAASASLCWIYYNFPKTNQPKFSDTKEIREATVKLIDTPATPHTKNLPEPDPQRNDNEFSKRFSQIRDGRAFVIDAWKYPERGGQFYASYLVDRCKFSSEFTDISTQAQPSVPSDGESHLLVISAFDRLKRLCGQFSQAELDLYSGRSLIEPADKKRDLLQASLNSFTEEINNQNSESRKANIKKVLSTQDPLLLDNIGARLSNASVSGRSVFYFDGVTSSPRDSGPLMSAFYLLPCGLGLDCGLDGDINLALECVATSNCYANRFEKVRLTSTEGRSENFQQVMDIYSRMLNAVQSGDASKFIAE